MNHPPLAELPVVIEPWSGRLCGSSELPATGQAIAREVDGRTIAVFNVAGTLYCVDDHCTHSRSSLSGDGRCEGTIVECALHRARFCLQTGRPLAGPTRRPLRVYDIEIRGEDVLARERVRG